jgi:hypothetical protein
VTPNYSRGSRVGSALRRDPAPYDIFSSKYLDNKMLNIYIMERDISKGGEEHDDLSTMASRTGYACDAA